MKTAIHNGLLGKTPYEVYILNKTHVDEIIALQQKVYEALPNKTILQPLTDEELLYILNGQGLMIGAFVNDIMIAFRALLIPEMDEEHLGYDIGLETAEDLQRVIYQEISNVDPDYRGFGLQKILATVIMKEVDLSKFDYICATVMPYNIASLKDKFAQGMYIGALKYKYGGKLRYVFAKPLHSTVEFNDELGYRSMDDIDGQQQLLNSGYLGVSMQKKEEDWYVAYQKIKQ